MQTQVKTACDAGAFGIPPNVATGGGAGMFAGVGTVGAAALAGTAAGHSPAGCSPSGSCSSRGRSGRTCRRAPSIRCHTWAVRHDGGGDGQRSCAQC